MDFLPHAFRSYAILVFAPTGPRRPAQGQQASASAALGLLACLDRALSGHRRFDGSASHGRVVSTNRSRAPSGHNFPTFRIPSSPLKNCRMAF